MELSKSEILRDWIKSKLDNNYDYSTKENRTRDFSEFINSHKEFDIKADKPLYHAILKKEITRKGLDLRAFGLTPQRPNFPESDMGGPTTPIPVIMPRIRRIEPEAKENTDPIVPTQTPELANFTEYSVGLTMKMMFNFLKIKYPFIESLTAEEQEALGQVWLPVFKRYLERNWAIVGVALFSTMSIMSTKIKDAKDKAKEEKLKEDSK